MDLKEMYAKLNELHAAAKKIIDGAQDNGMSKEDSAKVDAIYAEYDELKAKVEAQEKANSQRSRIESENEWLNQSAGRRTSANPIKPQETSKFEYRGSEYSIPDSKRPFTTNEYESAFRIYLATGINAGLQVSSDPKGGYLAPTVTSFNLIKYLDNSVFMRQLATVLPPLTNAVSLGVPSIEANPADADWTAEVPASDISEDTTMSFGKRELTPHLCTKLIKVSQKLLRASAISPESIISDRLGYKFGVTEEQAFLTGTGAQKPLGVFVASNDGVTTTQDTVCASASTFTADELIDCLSALKPQYQSRSTWIMHRDVLKVIRKMKDGNGQYLWQPGIQQGNAGTILDRPYVLSEYAPNTFSGSGYVAILGDFKTGYWIVDSLDLEIQRLNELAALKNQVGFLGRKETDGMPVVSEAFSRLRLL